MTTTDPRGFDELVEIVWARGLVGEPLKLTVPRAEAPTSVKSVSHNYSFDAKAGRSDLGKGGFSAVVERGIHKASGTPVAVKAVPKAMVGEWYLETHLKKGVFAHLLDNAKDRPHDNVVKFLDFMVTANFFYVVMEPLSGPNLAEALKSRAPVTEEFCRRASLETLSALAHIEGTLVHRDVKLENLVYRTASPSAPLVLIDFGLSIMAEPKDEKRDIAGTMIFAAPEVFSHVYGPPVDVWAAGVVLYIMLTGRPPAFDPEQLHSPESMMENLLHDALDTSELTVAPPLGVDLLRKLLTVDPQQRPSASQALRHPWFKLAATDKPLGVQKEKYTEAYNRIGRSKAFKTFVKPQTQEKPVFLTRARSHTAEANPSQPPTYPSAKKMSGAPDELLAEPEIPRKPSKLPSNVWSLEEVQPERFALPFVALAVGGAIIMGALRRSRRLQSLGGVELALPAMTLAWLPTIGTPTGWAPVLGAAAAALVASFVPEAVQKWLAYEPLQLQDGPKKLLLKARRVKHKRIRAELLGEVRMLAKQEFSVSAKDYSHIVDDVNLMIDQQLQKESWPGKLKNAPPQVSISALKRVMWQDSVALHEKYGKVVMVRVLSRNVVYVTDANVYEEIMNQRPYIAPHQTSFNLQLQQRLGGSDLAFTNMGQAWRRRRKATHSAFVSQIPTIANHAVDEAQRLCKRIYAKVDITSGEIDIIREFRVILVQTIASALYGSRFNEDEVDAMDACLKGIFDLAVLFDPFDYTDFCENLPPHTRYKRQMHELMEQIMAIHQPRFEAIRAAFDPRAKSTCVLEEYLKLQGGDQSSALSDFEILTMMHNVFSAAVDSTSVSGPWTMCFLLNRPDAVKRVQEEVEAATDGNRRWVRQEDLQKLPFLAGCFKESVRMRPPFPVLSRLTGNEPHEVGGYTLPPFTQLVLGVYVMNNLEENFDDPHSWKPERWLPEGAKLYPRKVRVFGGGPRICPGAQLAFENVQLLTASVLQNFDVLQTPKPSVELVGNSYSIPPQHFMLKCALRPKALIARKTKNARIKSQSYHSGVQGASTDADSGADGIGAKLEVFYCSSTGTAEQMALGLKSTGSAAGMCVNVTNLENWKGNELKDTSATCVFVASTYYNGEPPDSGRAFHAWLTEQAEGALKGLKFAVFANGNSQYEHYNWMGKEVSRHLLRLGGAQVAELGLGDASEDAETAWDIWQAGLLGVLAPQSGSHDAVLAAVEPPRNWEIVWQEGGVSCAAGTESRKRVASQNLGGFSLKARSELRDDTADGSCLELIFGLDGPTYETAQNLMLYPENSAKLVARMAELLQPPVTSDLDKPFTLKWVGEGAAPAEPPVSEPTTLRDVLTKQCDLTSKPKKGLLRELAGCAANEFEREALHVLLAPSGAEWFELKTAKGMTLPDFLTEYPSISFSAECLLTLLPSFRMQPRRYTISSSQLADPNLMRLTVTMHDKLLIDGKVLGGLCTHWLQNLPIGSPVRASVTASGFLPPKDPAAPIIMVGAGSGIAPIIAFCEMRQAQKLQGHKLGDAVLFFGCRNLNRDFIYRDRLGAWKAAGVITELVPAFSRPAQGEGKKRYVQDAVRTEGGKLGAMFKQGAYFYICGATAMGLSVRDALVTSGALAGVEEVKSLEQQGRYVQELWS